MGPRLWIALVAVAMAFAIHAQSPVGAGRDKVQKNCTFLGKKLYGKVKIVDSFPDECGKWKMVKSFPDFTIKWVGSFPDFKIDKVDSYPAVP